MLRVKHIHHMYLTIDDLEKARDFYGRILGLSEIKKPGVEVPILWFGCLGNELHLALRKGIKGGRTDMSLDGQERGREGRHVAFTVEGTLDDITKALDAEGIPYRRGVTELPQVFCEDPAGNFIELNTGWYQTPLWT